MMSEFHTKIGRIALVVALVLFTLVVVYKCVFPDAPSVETKTTTSVVEVKKEIETKQVETTKVEKQAEQKSIVIEHFDPKSGVLVKRKTTATKTKQKAKTYVLDRSTKAIDNQTKTDTVTEVKVGGASISKVSVGILATPTGVGPAVGLRLVKAGPVGVDLTVGWHVVGNQGPRGGVMVAAEVMPRLELGIGAVVVPPFYGQPLGIAPAAGLSYKF